MVRINLTSDYTYNIQLLAPNFNFTSISNFKGILSPRAILTYMMYFDPLITKNTFFFSKNVIFYPKFAFFRPILPISRTSCQEKSATTLSGKKCYSCQNLSVKYCYSPNLVRKKVLLAQTCQEKNAIQSFDRFDLIDFRSSNMFCLTSFKLSSTFFLTRFGE